LSSSPSGSRIDLVSGGPPCQSFSLAGLRQFSNERNLLPWEFAKFVQSVRPKTVLLENVSGILRPFKENGRQYYAWFEVAKAFAKVGYIPICLHINAKYVGVAQNRPRFVLLGIAEDIFEKSRNKSWFKELSDVMDQFFTFYSRVKNGEDLEYGHLEYLDIEKQPHLFESELLRHIKVVDESNFTTVKEAIDDLRSSKVRESQYVKSLNSVYNNVFGRVCNKTCNHELRSNSHLVRARFRLYQILHKLHIKESRGVVKYLKTRGQSGILEDTITSLAQHWILDINGNKINKPTRAEVLSLIEKLHTQKQTQRALVAKKPAPAALSIPDDACHYHESIESQRTLTVREMARIQSFPDWFEVKSKVTTGGSMRKFEVPQYTQIGNAVPPLLGRALGRVVRHWIS
jgi:DNA (cytosine-5)-methyltransferase 1